MAWIMLVIAGMLEVVWAYSLKQSHGFTRLGPSLLFLAAAAASFAGLAYALRGLPLGTAYAVWVGIGAALTAAYAMVFGGEPISVVKILLILGLAACVVGLKLVNSDH